MTIDDNGNSQYVAMTSAFRFLKGTEHLLKYVDQLIKELHEARLLAWDAGCRIIALEEEVRQRTHDFELLIWCEAQANALALQHEAVIERLTKEHDQAMLEIARLAARLAP